MKTVDLAPTLPLPAEALSDVVAILGRRGKGKTTTGVVFIEEAHTLGRRFCALDPVGVMWGIRSSRDGKAAGIPCVVFGGEHAMAPLEPTSGKVLADFVADPSQPSAVLDLKLMTKGEQVRFAGDFLSHLYQRNREPLLLVMDEADQFAPQRAMPGEQVCLGAAERAVKLGRARGLGFVLITQRPATLNKTVLTQAGILITHGLTGPQDQRAVLEWIRANADEQKADEVLRTLPGLGRGVAWVWAPDRDVLACVAIRDRETFDSSATPKQGIGREAQPRAVAEVDLERVSAEIKATIERAKAEDPKELRRQLAELGAKLKRSQADHADALTRLARKERAGKTREVPVLKDTQLKRLETAVDRARDASALLLKRHAQQVDALSQRLQVVVSEVGTLSEQIRAALTAALATPSTRADVGAGRAPGGTPGVPVRPAPVVPRPPRVNANGNGGLPKAERALLTAIAQRDPRPSTRAQISILAGYSIKSSSFQNAMSALRVGGHIAPHGDGSLITDAGREALGDFPAMPSPEERHAWWSAKLAKAERALLDVLVQAYPQALDREALSERSGYSVTSSSFQNALSTLRTLELIEGRGELRASEDLFS